MKQSVHPGMIAGAVVVVALIIFGLYKIFMPAGEKVSADSVPAYAKGPGQGGTEGARAAYGAAYGQAPKYTGAASQGQNPSVGH